MEQQLNQNTQQKLFKENNLSLGSGLTADVDVDRNGSVELRALDDNRISVKLPVKVKGELKIERKMFGQKLSTSFPFDDVISPEFSFQPEIGRNWDLNIKDLQINQWGKSMTYNLLGFDIDLGPLVKNQMQRVLNKQMAAADLSRFDFKNMAEETWRVFSEPYTVEQESVQVHFYTLANRMKVKEEIGMDQKLVLYLGMEGEVYSKIGDLPILPENPLPDIYYNENEANELDIILPLMISYQDLDQFLNEAFENKIIRLDSKTEILPLALRTSAYGERVLLEMDFKAIRKSKNEIFGTMYLAGIPDYDMDEETVRFLQPIFDVKSDKGAVNLAIRMRKGKIQRQIRKTAAFPIGDFLRELRRQMNQQDYVETDFASFRVMNPSLDLEGIYHTLEDVRVYFHAEGQMDVKLKSVPSFD